MREGSSKVAWRRPPTRLVACEATVWSSLSRLLADLALVRTNRWRNALNYSQVSPPICNDVITYSRQAITPHQHKSLSHVFRIPFPSPFKCHLICAKLKSLSTWACIMLACAQEQLIVQRSRPRVQRPYFRLSHGWLLRCSILACGA